MGERFARGDRAGVVVAATIATATAALVALDNVLGFTEYAFLAPGMQPIFTVLGSLAALSAVVLGSIERQPWQVVLGVSVLAFHCMRVVLPRTDGLPFLSAVVPVLVPLGFVVVALSNWWRAPSRGGRSMAAISAGLAVMWLVGTQTQTLPLEVFLAAEVAALAAATVSAAAPLLGRIGALVKAVRSSAAVR